MACLRPAAIGGNSILCDFHQEDNGSRISRFVLAVSTFQRVPLIYLDVSVGLPLRAMNHSGSVATVRRHRTKVE